MCGLVFIRLLFEKRSGTNNTSSSSQPVGLDSSTGSSLEIVKMAKIRLIILTIVMVMTTIGKAMFRYLDGEDKNRYLRHEMLIDAYTMPLVVVFVYPMLSVYNHNFLKKKFLRMINRVTPDPMYNTHVWMKVGSYASCVFIRQFICLHVWLLQFWDFLTTCNLTYNVQFIIFRVGKVWYFISLYMIVRMLMKVIKLLIIMCNSAALTN